MAKTFEELNAEVIMLRRKYPYIHRSQAWRMAVDEYERKEKKGRGFR